MCNVVHTGNGEASSSLQYNRRRSMACECLLWACRIVEPNGSVGALVFLRPIFYARGVAVISTGAVHAAAVTAEHVFFEPSVD